MLYSDRCLEQTVRVVFERFVLRLIQGDMIGIGISVLNVASAGRKRKNTQQKGKDQSGFFHNYLQKKLFVHKTENK